MKIYNTIDRKIEEFVPQNDKKVSMYTCGPTVYDIPHIGNLRKYICDDLLYRTLKANGYQVKRVMNVTDVDDKTIKRSGGDKQKFDKLTAELTEIFFDNLRELNIIKPEIITRATEYIKDMVLLVKDLLKKGYAYRSEDGSIYFSIAKFKNYGKLSGLDKRELKVGARVSQDEYEKENPADFALWKAWDEQDGEVYWETELGKGRPGWHIECSAMSMKELGETIDIHTGGVDNIFPHHENEIAQSEAKTGTRFVNFWVHNEHLLVDGKKMSKSLNNFYSLEDIKTKGFDPLDFRYFVLGAHYRSKINFTWNGMEAAKNAREKLKRFVQDNLEVGSEYCQIYTKRFYSKLNNDLASPEALAVVWELVRDNKKSLGKKIATLKKLDDEVLGLGLFEKMAIPKKIVELAESRKKARIEKDYKKSDELRDYLSNMGWDIEDLKENEYKLSQK